MAASPEHQFIAEEISSILESYSRTKLLGVLESSRKKYDYSCVIERDLERALVSQVLWSHTDGIYKDLVTLLHDKESVLKLYLVKDTLKHRVKIDEVIAEYRSNPATKSLLVGLRVIFLPEGFDADKEIERNFMSDHISRLICSDLLVGSVFGRLSGFDIRVFSNHGGPLGLKFAILDEITRNGLIHTPTFKKRLGYSTSGTIREATTMLAALGLVKRVDQSVILLPSLKGRMFLDLTRRILYDNGESTESSGELNIIKSLLFTENRYINSKLTRIESIISSALHCHEQFGRNLLEGVDPDRPVFHSNFNWQDIVDEWENLPYFSKEWFSDPDCGFYIK